MPIRFENWMYGAGLALAVAFAAPLTVSRAAEPGADGLVHVKSAYAIEETIARVKGDIAEKGITFFLEVPQSRLAAEAGIALRPSTLLIFGNPALGNQFLTSNPDSGIDWPVRLLVREDDKGQVWLVYSDFGWIADRHGIKDREKAFAMASEVIASIAGSVTGK